MQDKGDIDAMPTNDQLVDMLRLMLVLRVCDEKVAYRKRRMEIPGLLHLGVGEEAVAVGTCAAIESTDKVVSTHRAHGHFLAKGGGAKALLAELYGKETGCCKGKGGSMHLVDLACGFLGANGVVGGGLPLAVGAALAARVLGERFVTVCFFGDGANNQGTFHESLNLATVWNLPVVFVCENNGYGISASLHDQQRVAHVSDRAPGYGLPAEIIDGNDVLAVWRAVSRAAAAARAGKGPLLIECMTYRISGHYEGDPQKYRSVEEVESWKQKDPIARLERVVLERRILSPEQIAAMKAEVEKEMEEAVVFAKQSPFPSDASAHTDVYAQARGGM